jgi:hypothetical protein
MADRFTLGDLMQPIGADAAIAQDDIVADLVFREAPRVTLARQQPIRRHITAVARLKPEFAYLAPRIPYFIRGRAEWIADHSPGVDGWKRLSWDVLSTLPVPRSMIDRRRTGRRSADPVH